MPESNLARISVLKFSARAFCARLFRSVMFDLVGEPAPFSILEKNTVPASYCWDMIHISLLTMDVIAELPHRLGTGL
eukprot:4562593-Pyramimonas_sp.AAC.1